MKLRIFLHAADRPAPDTRYGWMLFDSHGAVLRDGDSTLHEIPRATIVEAILPAERVLFARLRLPRVNAATIRELLPFAVEDRLLADPAQIHAVAGSTDRRGETVVAVVDRDWLRAMLGELSRAGHAVRTAWCESALLPMAPGEWHIVWGALHGMLVDDHGVSATFDRGDGIPLALRIALDEAAGRGERPSSLSVHSQGDAALPDLAAWSAETGVACGQGPAWASVAKATPSKEAINLLQGVMAPASRLQWRLPRRSAVLAIAILLIQVAFTAVDERRLQRQFHALDAEREAVFREAFPEARVVVDPELQMGRNLAELRRSRGLAGGDEFLLQLSRAARDARAPVRSVEFANGKLVAR